MNTSHYLRLKKPTTPLATQKILPRICYTWCLSLRIRTSDSSQLEKRNEEKNKAKKERKKEKKRKDEKTRQGEEMKKTPY